MNAAKANDSLVTGRKYFLVFLASNIESFTVFRDALKPEQRKLLLSKIATLRQAVEKQNFSIKFNEKLSWISAPFTSVYRTLTSQLLQELIAMKMPSTLDSECKTLLKELADNCLTRLAAELALEKQQIDAILTQLLGEDEELKQFLLEESDTTLLMLAKKAGESKEAVKAYYHILFSIKENMDFLHRYNEYGNALSEFIRVHDDFWVRLSNFFAQFLAIFKTDSAKLIDAAKRCKYKIDELRDQYQHAAELQIGQLQADPNLAEEVKTEIKDHFHAQVNKRHYRQQSNAPLRKREARLLVDSLGKLFNNDSKPRLGSNISRSSALDEQKPPQPSFLL